MRRLSVCLALIVAMPATATDLILLNGRIWTGNPAQSTATAIAIDDGRIIAVGDDATVLKHAKPHTKRIDLKGRRVVPGINDAHTHITTSLPSLNLDIDRAGGSAAVKAALASQPKVGGWLTADIGIDVLMDPDMRRNQLDALQPDRPILLTGWTGHGMLVNTAGQRALKLDIDQVPVGGWVGRDAKGQFDGRVYEYAQWSPRTQLAKRPESLNRNIRNESDAFLKFGVTSIQNMAIGTDDADFISAWANVPLRVRVIRVPLATQPGAPPRQLALTGVQSASPQITVSGTKWILDGTPMERGGAMRHPYPDGTHGRINFTPAQLRALLKEALGRKDQILLHISGDAALLATLDAMNEVAAPDVWRPLRPRIEHGEGLSPDLIARAKNFGMILVQNPSHLMLPPEESRYLQQHQLQPLADVLKAGIPLALGSDGPPNPWLNMMFAIAPAARPDQALSREAVLRAYTEGSAYAEFHEQDKGKIALGYLADIAVLSQDVLDEQLPLQALPATTSVMTLINGEIAWRDPTF